MINTQPDLTRGAAQFPTSLEQRYEHEETRELVALVDDAAELVRARGKSAFGELSAPGSRWRQDERYITRKTLPHVQQ